MGRQRHAFNLPLPGPLNNGREEKKRHVKTPSSRVGGIRPPSDTFFPTITSLFFPPSGPVFFSNFTHPNASKAEKFFFQTFSPQCIKSGKTNSHHLGGPLPIPPLLHLQPRHLPKTAVRVFRL